MCRATTETKVAIILRISQRIQQYEWHKMICDHDDIDLLLYTRITINSVFHLHTCKGGYHPTYVTGFGKTDHIVTIDISRNTDLNYGSHHGSLVLDCSHARFAV